MKVDESGEGNQIVNVLYTRFDHNGLRSTDKQEGVQLTEEGDGDLRARLLRSIFSNHGNSSKYALRADQEDDGSGWLRLQRVSLQNNPENYTYSGVDLRTK